MPAMGTAAFAGVPGLAVPAPIYVPAAAPATTRSDTRWKWSHLWIYGLFAMGIPAFYGLARPTGGTFSGFINFQLLVQIICYMLAAATAYVLVHKVHKGDWSSLGISFSELSYEEVLKGAGFGLALILSWIPIGFLLSGGEFEFDMLMQVLLGGTSGPGLLMASIILLVGAPIIEEIYFRGMLYEKLAAKSTWTAIIVTSLLFVLAHGALIIPPLLLLSFALGWKRQTHGLWYTMGAHGAWNFVVLILAAYVLLGPASAFTSVDGAYTVKYPADWQRTEDMEMAMPGVSLDLVLTGPNASMIAVTRIDVPARAGITPDHAIKRTLEFFSQTYSAAALAAPSEPVRISSTVGGGTAAYELRSQVSDPTTGMTGESRQIAVMPTGWTKVIVFQLVCPTVSCSEAAPDFEQLMSTTVLAPAS
jgi:membrane protease YdiL (CAAX protease family)